MYRLLRIEAVNLRYVIDDTEDLSTRRGGSYMLLQAVKDISEEFKGQLEPISTGASIGLFQLKEGQKISAEDVNNFLQGEGKPYSHATFSVDIVQDTDFRTAVEKALAANRWQQMTNLNFCTNWGSANEVCKIDELRPGASEDYLPGEKGKKPLSTSVFQRREAGCNLRQTVYENILDDGFKLLSFTDDTASLSTFQAKDIDYRDVPANLNGKMAVFYADGNSFGKIQLYCQTPEELLQWDTNIKEKRKQLLKDLLSWLQQTNLAKTKTQTQQLRFETLLWGGDEMLFLLPAWLALAFAQKFFDLTQAWEYKNKPLKHAAGLVIAKHSTPISQLQKLAKQLAEHGKADDKLKEQNTLSWVVLESFDNTGNQIDHYWKRNGIEEKGWRKLILTENRLAKLMAMQAHKEALPRSALVRVLRTLARGKYQEEEKLIQRSYVSAQESLAENEDALKALWQAFDASWNTDGLPKENEDPSTWAAEQAVPWTALLELWDYILPLPEEITGTLESVDIRDFL